MESNKTPKDPVKIMACDCEHEFQDKTYGKGRRVYNHAPSVSGYRCTVCLNEKRTY